MDFNQNIIIILFDMLISYYNQIIIYIQNAKQKLLDIKTEQEKSSKGLSATLNDLTRTLQGERQEKVKKDAEITALRETIKKNANEEFVKMKAAEANKRKVDELETIVFVLALSLRRSFPGN